VEQRVVILSRGGVSDSFVNFGGGPLREGNSHPWMYTRTQVHARLQDWPQIGVAVEVAKPNVLRSLHISYIHIRIPYHR